MFFVQAEGGQPVLDLPDPGSVEADEVETDEDHVLAALFQDRADPPGPSWHTWFLAYLRFVASSVPARDGRCYWRSTAFDLVTWGL